MDEITNVEIEVKGWGDTFRLSSVQLTNLKQRDLNQYHSVW